MKQAKPKRTRLRASGKKSQPNLSKDAVKTIEERIAYRFKDRTLLINALTHPSAVGSGDSVALSNQRLEFLGDRVLNLVIAERLIDRRRTESEGDLAPHLNRLVCKAACAAAMRFFGLQAFLILSDGEDQSGGRERESTLGDACEAVIGAIYLDGGLKEARKFVETSWAPLFKSTPTEARDPKTLLQEWAQGKGHPLPKYSVTDRSGPDHAPTYIVQVEVATCGIASGRGTSKRDAERSAAAELYKELTETA